LKKNKKRDRSSQKEGKKVSVAIKEGVTGRESVEKPG